MRQRSFFGPLLLIAAGVVWLLIAMNVIPASNLWALGNILPYALIALGLGLILRSRWAIPGWLVSGVVLAGAVLAILFAPQLSWNNPPPWGMEVGFSGAVQGSGKVETEMRKLNDFHGISVEYPAEVVIRQTGAQSVEIEADANLLPQLGTEVRAGILHIENKEPDWTKRVRPSRSVRITITVKDLNEIDLPSAGNVQVEELTTDALKIVLSGAGDISLDKLQAHTLEGILSGAGNIRASGSADEIRLRISGFGNVEAPDLASLKADIHITGAGNATVRVKDDLTAAVSGAGSIRYYGSPQVVQNISGAGSVKPAGQ